MLRPECLDPREVLTHLNSLGYHNITPQQLKEFIHDLKKLIKYDQKQYEYQGSSDSLGDKSYNEYSDEASERTSESDKTSCNESYEGTSDFASSSSSYKENSNISEMNNKGSSRTVPTSFIRPWNLPVYNNLSNRSKKNLDPVRLYHEYKKSWSRLNIPGESKHSQLRWIVRNRMMGQEPQPRVIL